MTPRIVGIPHALGLPPTIALSLRPFPTMSRNQIFKLLYAGLGLFGAYLLGVRLLAGDWLSALVPLAVLTLCVYRLFTMEDAS